MLAPLAHAKISEIQLYSFDFVGYLDGITPITPHLSLDAAFRFYVHNVSVQILTTLDGIILIHSVYT